MRRRNVKFADCAAASRAALFPAIELAAIVLLLTALAAAAHAQQPPTHALVKSVDAIGMTVSDMDRAVDFYSKILTFKKISDTEVDGTEYEHLEGVFGAHARVVRMQLGDEFIELTEFLAPRGRPIPVDSRSNDRWFQHIAIIVSDMDRAYVLLRQNKVEHASSGPQLLPSWNKNAAGIRAFYFKDPDGHPLEILQFPPDKGLAKWHTAEGRLFLGIDHTAIVVADTEASLRFYGDILGMRIADTSENYGTEQEHLNNVFGARLRITSLRAAQGPGVELLEYLAPRDGRTFPADERANDIVHRETVMRSVDVIAAEHQLEIARALQVSSGVVTTHSAALNFKQSAVVRDPDGHVVEIRGVSSETP